MREPGRECRRLTEVAAESDDPEPRVSRLYVGQQIERRVRAAVVDDDDFVSSSEGLERCRELFVERSHVRRLVAHRNDDGNFRIHRFWRDHKRLIISGFRLLRQLQR